MPRPFVITIDVEPDERELPVDERRPWSGFEDCLAVFETLRGRLEARTGRPVAFTWCVRLDPQIEAAYGDPTWPLRRYGRQLAEAGALGDVTGVHTHAFRWNDEVGSWMAAHGDPEWVAVCLRRSLAAFTAVHGHPPTAFRFGDRWHSNATVALLSRLGVRYDLTLEPGAKEIPSMKVGELATGSLPDYQRVPRCPYRPATRDYQRPGPWWARRRSWMLPVSTGVVNGPALPTEVLPEHAFVHLNLCLHPQWIRHILDGVLGGGDPVLVSVLRAGDLAFPAERNNFLENMETLATHPALDSVVFTTRALAIRHWQAAVAVRSAK